MDIYKHSKLKRWFGYRTECANLASFALLVHWDTRDAKNIKAHVYLTGETFTGEIEPLLTQVENVLTAGYFKKYQQAAPPKDRGFFTQAFKGELRKHAMGRLFIEPKIPPEWAKTNCAGCSTLSDLQVNCVYRGELNKCADAQNHQFSLLDSVEGLSHQTTTLNN